MFRFVIGESDFLLDDEPHQIISGALHYFRVHPDQWADRIRKARLMGLNAIETYVAWNAHAPHKGEFITDGALDLARFLELVHAEGLHAIVRPGPYICAEWNNGGLPSWLLHDPRVAIRRFEPLYIEAVDQYLRQVYSILAPMQIDRGGPVILVQIENEYGAYGNDKAYLAELARITRQADITVPLVTVDQPRPDWLEAGSLPGVHQTASFGSRSVERLTTLRKSQPTGPLMCMEFWNGWFDSWGTHHHVTSVDEAAGELDALLAAGASVNIYMFHGGTNFGLTNGANDNGTYRAITTSYDYDAPLSESGDPTPKYYAYRDVISKYRAPSDEPPKPSPPAPAFDVPLQARANLFDMAEINVASTVCDVAPTFTDMGFEGSLAIYRARLDIQRPALLTIDEVRDRAWIFVDGTPCGVLSREARERATWVPAGSSLTILVEDQGRVNYGPRLGEPKGLIGVIRLNGDPLTPWTMTPIELERFPELVDHSGIQAQPYGPHVAQADFALKEATDLFLDTSIWGKGFVWINDFNVGRYWRRGPQHTLYIPGAATQAGRNRITILELEAMRIPTARFVSRPWLGPHEP